MAYYTFYFLRENMQIAHAASIEFPSTAEAAAHARSHLPAHPAVEIWRDGAHAMTLGVNRCGADPLLEAVM